jgi:hypothetical protein
VTVVPLESGWPLDMESAQRRLRHTADTHPLVSGVCFNETAGDPSRQIETWLAQNLFRLSERWVGALRVLEYASGPPEWHDRPLEATFGGMMALEAADSARVVVGESQIVCVRLVWRAEAPIDRAYKIAAHIVDASGTVIAQYDGEPMGYLAPTNAWVPGQTVVDQFAIRLPDGVRPGRYAVRIIVYDSGSLGRLRLTDIDGTPDFVVIDEVTVSPAE